MSREAMGRCFLKPLTAVIAIFLSVPRITASPTSHFASEMHLPRAVPSDQATGGPNSILYAVLAIVVFTGILGALLLVKRAYLNRRARTAEAGARNNVTFAPVSTGEANERPRRTRRPQRTPSQISTRSLPQYNLDPRDEDIVLLRAHPEDEHDHVDGRSSPRPSGESMSLNGPITTASDPFSVPLLQDPLRSRRRDSDVGEVDGGIEMSERATDENSSLVRERGEAPPYFEVPLEQQTSRDSSLVEGGGAVPRPPSQNPSRFSSTFRNLIGRGSRVITPQDVPMAESPTNDAASGSSSIRPRSTTSRLSSIYSPSRRSVNGLSNVPSGPRPRSTSGTSSLMPTGQRSTISVNSIGSPLPQTLVRTEYTYPKAGATPEQIAFLASTDTLTRFGVPFGQDARALSAAERLDREMPPPSFEDTISAGTAEGSSIHSRGASVSSGAFMPTVETVAEVESPLSVHPLPNAVSPSLPEPSHPPSHHRDETSRLDTSSTPR